MGIRLKLLILLLLISLIPLLAVGIGIKRDLARLRKNQGSGKTKGQEKPRVRS